MRFTLLDRITLIEPGRKLVAVKCLSLAEEYLEDHFPRFPVMPGVFMLEALAQAGAWLVRASEDFAHSVVVLKQARHVKYADFIEPGQVLTVTVEQLSQDDRETKLKATGTVDGRQAVSGRLTLERYNLADTMPRQAGADEYCKQRMKQLFAVLYPQGATDELRAEVT